MKVVSIVSGLILLLSSVDFAFGFVETSLTGRRQGKLFPFYTVGRFENVICTGTNRMTGTCVVKGECTDAGGTGAGSCNALAKSSVCCVYTTTCGGSTANNNTYWYNTNYPGTYNAAGRCTLSVSPCDTSICQLRIDFLAFTIAPPDGNGDCTTDSMTVSGGNSRVPKICGENTGSHVYVDFNGASPITIAIDTSSTSFNRIWQFQVSQIACASATKAPSGCLQFYNQDSGTVSSFNYGSTAASRLNSVGVGGTRQLTSTKYGICVRTGAGKCSITWTQVSGDPYSFTVTGDVGAVDPTLVGTSSLQSQTCTTDYIVIPSPVQGTTNLPLDRFCGMGLAATTSSAKPFVLYTVTDANDNPDILNRGFSLSFTQGNCAIA